MINIADTSVACECGESKLAPATWVVDGAPLICGGCARTYVVDVVLQAVPWSTVSAMLDDAPSELAQFEWIRNGVPQDKRRTLAEIQATGGRFARVERFGTVIGVLILVAAAVLVLRGALS